MTAKACRPAPHLRRAALLLAAVIWLGAPSVAAGSVTARDSLRVGLVLSGGSARGFAHIGVLRALEESGVPIDVVSGTSMGALIGALYASGYTPAELAEIARRQDWDALFTDAPDRRTLPVESKLAGPRPLLELPIRRGRPQLPLGLVAGQRIYQMIAQLTWHVHSVREFRSLPTPFVAVATDVESGAAVVLDHGSLPEALRASIAIPSVFAPARLDGKVLIDGGISRNLPAEDALALGADLLICSDVSRPLQPADSLRSLIDVLDQTIAFRTWGSTEEQRSLCDVLIEPAVADLSGLAFERVADWIERGESAARQHLPELLDVVQAAGPRPAQRGVVGEPDSTFVESIALEGVQRSSRRFLRGILNLKAPGWISPAELDDAIARLYNTDLFASVTYRLDLAAASDGSNRILIVRVEEEPRDRLGFSYRYDSRYKASLLMAATLHNLFTYGSVSRLHLRVGEQLQVVGEHHRRTGPGRVLSLGGRAEFSRSPFDIFEGKRRIAAVDLDRYQLSAIGSVALGNSLIAGLRLQGEYARAHSAITAEEIDEADLLFTLAALLRAETLDRESFPSSGISLLLKSEWAERGLGSGASFSHNVLDLQGYLPLRSGLSLLGRATLGATSGPDLPFHYTFFLGGSQPYFLFPDRQFPFLGLDTQERRGRHLQSFRLGVQLEISEHILTQVLWNAGRTMDVWSFDPGTYLNGYGLLIGARTVFGNASLTLSETDFSEWPDVSLDLGYQF